MDNATKCQTHDLKTHYGPEHIEREIYNEKGFSIGAELFEEIVRCKDCRWYENRYGEVCHNPRYGDGHAHYSPPYVDGEYFCKDGERSEE